MSIKSTKFTESFQTEELFVKKCSLSKLNMSEANGFRKKHMKNFSFLPLFMLILFSIACSFAYIILIMKENI